MKGTTIYQNRIMPGLFAIIIDEDDYGPTLEHVTEEWRGRRIKLDRPTFERAWKLHEDDRDGR